MTVKILAADQTHDDDTIIAVCIANYLVDRGVNNENIYVVRVLDKVLERIPEKTKKTLIDSFKLAERFDFAYIEKNKTDTV